MLNCFRFLEFYEISEYLNVSVFFHSLVIVINLEMLLIQHLKVISKIY